MPNLAVALVVVLQQGLGVSNPAPTGQGFTTPPGGDTVGYWQQRVHYTITATLDERAQRVRAHATLKYVNNSPDTLREMYVHQYLNAFRPRSKWSAVDEREGRDRFQHLEEPYYGYERFTAPVRVNGAPVSVAYPGAPDSTVARFALPSPLAPGDSLNVDFQWDARPSVYPRRQGRQGRHWDLAQWYPKVAVYDRGGWEFNALQPAGELYGEYGTYDVTLNVAPDQVLGATGVPIAGDPGWSRVIRAGSARLAADAYGNATAASPPPAGYRAVRFFARDVHHFAWSASPDYRYEGGIYARRAPPSRFRTWDTVSIHVLWRPGDDTTWGGQRVLQRTVAAMRWLEMLYGPYAYPQMTVLHRIDRGGTEFPMMQMNGSPSQGLILHEGGHVWTYGILGDNEWRSGWLDEGLTSYQTAWAQLLTPAERQRAGIVDEPAQVRGYRRLSITRPMPRFEVVNVSMAQLDLEDRAQPLGTTAHQFRDFDTYNDMIYDRAEVMYGQLRDVMGDSLFVTFLQDYYARWALRHVDERAMRASAERVSGHDLGWFFEQWVHRTGVMDYALRRVRTRREGSGWVTEATVRRRGKYLHPMNVGVRTDSGWTFERISYSAREAIVRVATAQEPREVRLDPYHVTWDWDRRNDRRWGFWSAGAVRYVFDWPFLDQIDREKRVSRYRPTFWYSDPRGGTIGISERSNYLGFFQPGRLDVAASSKVGSWPDAMQGFLALESGRNPDFQGAEGIADDLFYVMLGSRHVRIAGARERELGIQVSFAGQSVQDVLSPRRELPELWHDTASADITLRGRWKVGSSSGSYWFARPTLIAGWTDDGGAYEKAEIAAGRVLMLSENESASIRLYAGGAFGETPTQRGLYLSAQDPVSTFGNHWWRPRGAILKRPNVNWLPLGGPALRGFHWSEATEWAVGGNVELGRKLFTVGSRADTAGVWLTLFADAATVDGGRVTFSAPGFTGNQRIENVLFDAGPGLAVRGKIYDLPVSLRFDFPLIVAEPTLSIDRGHAGRGTFAPRWTIAFNDIW